MVRSGNHVIAVVMGRPHRRSVSDLEMVRLLDQTFTQIAANLFHAAGPGAGAVATGGAECPPPATAELSACSRAGQQLAARLSSPRYRLCRRRYRRDDEDAAEAVRATGRREFLGHPC